MKVYLATYERRDGERIYGSGNCDLHRSQPQGRRVYPRPALSRPGRAACGERDEEAGDHVRRFASRVELERLSDGDV